MWKLKIKVLLSNTLLDVSKEFLSSLFLHDSRNFAGHVCFVVDIRNASKDQERINNAPK